MKQYRQGDVLLVKVDRVPEGAKQAGRDKINRVVLAVGEQSGHAHAIRNPNVTAFKMETAEGDLANRALVDYITVSGGGAKLSHEYETGAKADHDAIELEDGDYRVIQQREFEAPGVNLAAFD